MLWLVVTHGHAMLGFTPHSSRVKFTHTRQEVSKLGTLPRMDRSALGHVHKYPGFTQV
jgi:hypothetical protein